MISFSILYYTNLNHKINNYFNIFYQSNNFISNFNSKFTGSNDYSNDLDQKFEMIKLLNNNYISNKFYFLKNLPLLIKSDLLILRNFSGQFAYKKYIYEFKNKLEYIKVSLLSLFQIYRKKKKSILYIQKIYRGFICRKRLSKKYMSLKYIKYIKSIINLEKWIKGFLYRKSFKIKFKSLKIVYEEDNQIKEIENFFKNPLNIDDVVYFDEDIEFLEQLKSKNFEMIDENLDNNKNIIDEKPNETIIEKEIIREDRLELNKISINKSNNLIDELNVNTKLNDLRSHINNKLNSKPKKLENIKIININENINVPKLPNIQNNIKRINKCHVKEKQELILPILSNTNESDTSISQSSKSVSSFSRSKFLPNNTKDRIKLLEEEARLAIKIAKEENQFSNPQLNELVAKKIKKKYEKKIQKLLYS